MSAVFFYSPFSLETVSQGGYPALLLQFVLDELLHARENLVETEEPPPLLSSLSRKAGSLNKVKEHAFLLEKAFPALEKESKIFRESLHKNCHTLFRLLEPFILKCKDNEYLLYFLLKHQKNPEINTLLHKIFPQGLEKIKTFVAAKYRKKGIPLPSWMS